MSTYAWTPFQPLKLNDEDSYLQALYAEMRVPSDALPYTAEFEEMFRRFSEKFPESDRGTVLRRIFALRKAGLLARTGRLEGPPVRASSAEIDRLRKLIREQLGTLGARDGLPYSPEFDSLLQKFNEFRATPVHAAEFWRLIARATKSGA